VLVAGLGAGAVAGAAGGQVVIGRVVPQAAAAAAEVAAAQVVAAWPRLLLQPERVVAFVQDMMWYHTWVGHTVVDVELVVVGVAYTTPRPHIEGKGSYNFRDLVDSLPPWPENREIVKGPKRIPDDQQN
jgi:hypothetical protein